MKWVYLSIYLTTSLLIFRVFALFGARKGIYTINEQVTDGSFKNDTFSEESSLHEIHKMNVSAVTDSSVKNDTFSEESSLHETHKMNVSAKGVNAINEQVTNKTVKSDTFSEESSLQETHKINVSATKSSYDNLSPEQRRWHLFQKDYWRRYQRQPPNTLKQWLAFAFEKKCETTRFYDTIDQHLAPFRNSSLSLQHAISGAGNYTHFHIVFSIENNTMSVEKFSAGKNNEFKGARPKVEKRLGYLFRHVVEHKPPIRTKFVINLHDKGKVPSNGKYPIFSWDHQLKNPNQGYGTFDNPINWTQALQPVHDTVARDLLLPYIGSIYTEGTSIAGQRPKGPDWHNRDDVIIWRGSPTSKWGSGPRFQMIETYAGKGAHPIAPNSSVIADFAFVTNNPRILEPKYRVADRITYDDIEKHKYVLDIDGVAFTERFPKLLYSGCLVFKSTAFQEWFSERVVPWVDYIPVKYDQSDLVEKVEWAHAHPKIAADIVKHARWTVEKHLRQEDLQCYTYRLMLEYHAIFQTPKRSSLLKLDA